jgi:hypothetical protein
MENLLDANPPLRSADQWNSILSALVASLSSSLGVAFQPSSWFVRDDIPGYASASNCVDVWATLSERLAVQICGVICVQVNFGEAVWVICDLLLFANGHRLRGPKSMDVIRLAYTGQGWVLHGWGADDYGEWEGHTDAARWNLE